MLLGEPVQTLYQAWSAARSELGVKLLAYVVMPEHFHTILWAETGASVRKFLQRALSVTGRPYEGHGRFRKERPRVLPVSSGKVLKIKTDYLHANPVRRGLVPDPAEWPHSSYRQLVLGVSDPAFVCDAWDGISL